MKSKLSLLTSAAALLVLTAGIGCSKNRGLNGDEQDRLTQADFKAKQADERAAALDKKAKELQESEAKNGKDLERREADLNAKEAALGADRRRVVEGQKSVAAEREAAAKLLSNNQSVMTEFLRPLQVGEKYPVMVVIYGVDKENSWDLAKMELIKLDQAEQKQPAQKRPERGSYGEFKTYSSLVFLGSADKYLQYTELLKKQTLLFAYAYPVTQIKVRSYLEIKTTDRKDIVTKISESTPIDVGLRFPEIKLSEPTTYAGVPATCAQSMTVQCLVDLKQASALDALVIPERNKPMVLKDFLRAQAEQTVKTYQDPTWNSSIWGMSSISEIILTHKVYVVGAAAQDGVARSAGKATMDGVEFSDGKELVITPIVTKAVGLDEALLNDNIEMGSYFKKLAKSL